MEEKILINKVVNNQLLPNNITKDSVIELFRTTDKTIFVNEADHSLVNIDENFFFLIPYAAGRPLNRCPRSVPRTDGGSRRGIW